MSSFFGKDYYTGTTYNIKQASTLKRQPMRVHPRKLKHNNPKNLRICQTYSSRIKTTGMSTEQMVC